MAKSNARPAADVANSPASTLAVAAISLALKTAAFVVWWSIAASNAFCAVLPAAFAVPVRLLAACVATETPRPANDTERSANWLNLPTCVFNCCALQSYQRSNPVWVHSVPSGETVRDTYHCCSRTPQSKNVLNLGVDCWSGIHAK